MSEVTLTINGRGYSISCDPGQEQRLQDLSRYINSRLREIATAGAATNETHLLILTALVLADEIADLRDALRHGADPEHAAGLLNHEELMVTEAINHLASKINHIADRIQRV